jgi:anti-sigma factor RsiW
MRCTKVIKKIVSYLDGELSERDASSVKEHLVICQTCRNEVEALSRANEYMNLSHEVAVSPDFGEKFWQRVEREKPGYGRFSLQDLLYRIKFIPFPAEVAAVLIIGIFLGLGVGQLAKQTKIENAKKYYFGSIVSEVPTEALATAYLNVMR